jgi:hypothetical protein
LTSTERLGIGFGEMIPGAGFSAGPRYSKTLLHGHLRVTTYVRGSTKLYYVGGIQGSLSHRWNNRAGLDFSADHFDYSQMPYYGPGRTSQRTGRSDYRLEKTESQIRPTLRPVKGLSLGALGGFQAINVGPGASSLYISSDRQYTPEQAPGIEEQTNYLTGGGFVQFDWRDRTGDATQGGKYRAEYTKFSDYELGRYSFYRLNLDASEYLPLFNGKRVIALHGRTSLSDTRFDENPLLGVYAPGGREPVIRISTSLLALCCQSGLVDMLETPMRARRRSIGSKSFRMSPLLIARFTSARIAPQTCS